MNLADTAVVIMAIGVAIWGARKIREERRAGQQTVVMKSVPGLIIAAVVFALVALALGAASINLLVHGDHTVTMRRLGVVHNWALASWSLLFSVAMAYASSTLLERARELRGPR